jgi:flavin-dependent dehydrogenase
VPQGERISAVDDLFDAAVCGGGPSGAIAARTLAQAGWRVVLADAGRACSAPAGESLPPAATPILRDLRLSHVLNPDAHLVCPGNVAVWGDSVPTDTDFLRDPNGLGWHLDRGRFDADLRAAARAAGVSIWSGCRVLRCAAGPTIWNLTVSCVRVVSGVRARWLIDARGRCGASIGGPPARFDHLVASVAIFPAAPDDFDARSWVEAVEGGWWYTAPVPGHRRMLAYFADSDLLWDSPIRTGESLLTRLGETSQIRRAFNWSGEGTPLRRFAAHSATRGAFAGNRWLGVGDATIAFDPLSSQGLFHALYTGLRGAEAVLAADAGDASAVSRYESRLRAVELVYRRNLLHYYRLERRWSDAPFWQRRHTSEQKPIYAPCQHRSSNTAW